MVDPMQIYLAPLVCLAGLVIYLLVDKPKPSQLGFAMFCCGLLASLLQFAGKSFGIH
jgi:hypothetical protein